jgi:hypothetical protein
MLKRRRRADKGRPEPDDVEPEAVRRRSEEAFVTGLTVRGDAAKPDKDGELPPGATHEIVEQRPGRLPKVRRRRFSLF